MGTPSCALDSGTALSAAVEARRSSSFAARACRARSKLSDVGYRESPAEAPIVIALGRRLYALERATGAKRWQHDFPEWKVSLLFQSGETLWVVMRNQLSALELATGRVRSQRDLAFLPSVGLLDDRGLYLAGADGAALVAADGTLRWSCSVETENEFFVLVCRDSAGDELWREKHRRDKEIGIALGDLSVQPIVR
jgi:outer membrane protein assembly factor BamB